MNIIEIHNLSKKYIISHDKAATGAYRYKSLRDSIAHTCRGVCQRIRHPMSPNAETTALEEFWALKDINFEIKQGEKIGIIGSNGAGKSTLLKILSRITEPTTGKVTIKGRIASLLEVGTGFHPELSGRENIYLNGAILGMSSKEIKNKFDEIVDFSGVEKFLDTPVKRYSSGMYVRLAFAVAAHLEPEILLVDEVLAVGDAEFQKKCLGKMDDISKQGRTILFVSHNMEAVKRLCSCGILLKSGQIHQNHDISQCIKNYINIASLEVKNVYYIPKPAIISEAFFYRVQIEDSLSQTKNRFAIDEYWQIRVFFRVLSTVDSLVIGFGIVSNTGMAIRTTWTKPAKFLRGDYCIIFKKDIINMTSADYSLNIGLSIGGEMNLHYVDKAAVLSISNISLNSKAMKIDSGLLVNQMDFSIQKITE